MPYLFAVTLFVSAALLFCVEPLVAKMVLPLLGGSPAVWNTCLVFFQAALLGGYLYAHASAALLGARAQMVLHLGLLALAAVVLPLAVPTDLSAGPPPDTEPVPWLLMLLLRTVGLPFFVMAASAPLLQKWFASTRHPDARDPYFLYAASNLGSMIALLGYPLVLEPSFTRTDQGIGWSVGYAGLILLTAACAIPAWKAASEPTKRTAEESAPVPRPSVPRCLRWVVLALVPSSLLLGVTAFVTTDIAAIPLLWVIPLALYLLSFILVFARKELLPLEWMNQALPVLALLATFTMLRATETPPWVLILLHWLVLFAASMVCHGQLAKDRPAPRYLTGYYLWISLGGVLGGLFTAFLAPLLFRGSVLEYPLMMVLACWLRPGPSLRESSSVNRWLDLLVPGMVAVLCLMLVLGYSTIYDLAGKVAAQLTSGNPLELKGLLTRAVVFGGPALVCWLLASRPTRFALSLAAVLLVFMAHLGSGRTVYVDRNFFGIIRVQDDPPVAEDDESQFPRSRFRVLNHGVTEHGLQRLDDRGNLIRPAEALAYFHETGPVGDVFPLFWIRCQGGLRPTVGVTGLGVGALASYANPGESWTYYEIDPAMVHAARTFFTFLDDCEIKCKASPRILLGDARLRLREANDGEYGLIVLDAFSSDSVPAHLISREALALYRAKRAPGGLLVFNVSNRYLDLKRVLADLADDAGMVCFVREQGRGQLEKQLGLRDSQWVVMADRVEDLEPLTAGHEQATLETGTSAMGLLGSPQGQGPLLAAAVVFPGRTGMSKWTPLPGRGARAWSDDFSNILEVFKWR